MAESSVTFFLEKLNNLVVREASILGEVEGEVQLLRNELRWMRLFLKDADSKCIYDERIKLWVEQIREVAHNAEDVIDLFIFNVDHQRQRRLKNLKCLPTFVGMADKLPFIHELGGKIKAINVMIEKIMANRSKYGFDTLLTATSTSSTSADQERRIIRTNTTVEDTHVVEIKEGLEEVKNMLLIKGEGDQTIMRRKVVSIVGMGGLGKTTLAKKVYNHSDVKRHFDCHAWVSVSQEFRLRELLLTIINSVNLLNKKEKKEMEEMEDKDVGTKLRECLNHKKYMIVMDDVWSIEAWKCMASHLPDSGNGSRVLITTRNQEIAEAANSHELGAHTYQLRLMNDGESRELFLRKTFGVIDITEDSLPEAMKDLGRKIVGKCKGLPLAIVVLGGLLSTKEKTAESWGKVFESVNWHLNRGGAQSCLGILALSYNDLPYYLKSCFLYCGIFPEDYEIKARKLINLWIAEGFIERRGKETLEDIGEDYLNELIRRSMVQVAAKKLNGRVKSCRIHDLLRDLSIAEARDARLFDVKENIDLVSASPTSTVRRLSIHDQHFLLKNNISQHLHNSLLRSLIFFTHFPIEKKFWRCIKEHVKLLGVLDLGGAEAFLEEMPEGIGELIHLKFLSIRRFHGTMKLPSSIGRLTNLQHLDLSYWDARLPHDIWNLQQLRHLFCPFGMISSQYSKLSKWKNGHLAGVEQLTNLQTLALLAGSWLNGKGLGKLTQLRRLEVRGLTPTHYMQLFHCIAKLTALRTLHLSASVDDKNTKLLNCVGLKRSQNDIDEDDQYKLISGLISFSRHIYLHKLVLGGKLGKLPEQTDQFYPPNLLVLDLWRCELKDDPMLSLQKLPNLRILGLGDHSFVGKSMTCSPEGFQKLETLHLENLYELEELIVEEGSMCNLRTLKVQGCHQMEVLPRGLGLLRLRKLEKFELVTTYGCENLIKKEVEQSEGEEWDRIRRITSIKK